MPQFLAPVRPVAETVAQLSLRRCLRGATLIPHHLGDRRSLESDCTVVRNHIADWQSLTTAGILIETQHGHNTFRSH